MEPYPFEVDIPMRFCDLDAMGHVNNAVFATYFEQGRLAFLVEVLGAREVMDIGFILARLEIDYLRPVTLGQALRLGLRIATVGNSSFVLEYRLTADGAVAAQGRSVQVFFDYEKQCKQPVPETFREQIRPYLAAD